MAIDQALVGQMAANLMEQLEAAYGEEAEITAATLIVAVDHGDDMNTIHSNFSPGLATYQALGLVEHVNRTRFGSGIAG
jgi:hypothetical protein